MKEIRWKQRLHSFSKSLEGLDQVYERSLDHELDPIELQAIIKSFELCYETAWNLMKDWLEYQGIFNITGSRDAIREAFRAGLILDGETWMGMIQNRNRASHTYDIAVAWEVKELIVDRYHPLFHLFKNTMEEFVGREKDDSL